MMAVIFNDLRRETYTRIGNVIQLQSDYAKIDGRMTKVWRLIMADGEDKIFKQKDFTIERVEI